MSLSLLSRYAFFAVCVMFTLASLPFLEHDWLWPITVVTGILSLVGLFDLLQSPHAVRRNYPILGQHPLPGRSDSPGNPPVPARIRQRRPALLPRPALAGLFPGQERERRQTVRHVDRCVPVGLRIHRPFDAPGAVERPAAVSASPSAARSARSRTRRRCSTSRP